MERRGAMIALFRLGRRGALGRDGHSNQLDDQRGNNGFGFLRPGFEAACLDREGHQNARPEQKSGEEPEKSRQGNGKAPEELSTHDQPIVPTSPVCEFGITAKEESDVEAVL
jgi:hypothetical protein